MNDKERQASVIKDGTKSEILSFPNVVGVGVGRKNNEGEPSITVMVREKKPLAALARGTVLPRHISNVPTDVVQVGDIRALQSRTDRWRPAPGGVSIGHYKITAGTLGSAVRDARTGTRLLLSNNHVFANSNDAEVGDPILQPGPYDGGSVVDDTLASLYRFVSINFGTSGGICPWAERYARFGNFVSKSVGSLHRVTVSRVDQQATNYVDAAVALPNDQIDIEDRIIGVGVASGTAQANLGMEVTKSGRTTETTHGTINLINATISVQYGAGQIAVFEDQIVSGYMSQGGDSGSLVVTRFGGSKAVGLLFAGSDQATIYNPIQRVLDALEITI
jgi:hypothetical protein